MTKEGESNRNELTVAELEARIRELEAELGKKQKDYLYLYAEFENFKKRSAHEQAEMFRFGWGHIASELLEVLDSLSRALAFAGKNTDPNFIQGLELTLKQLQSVLEKHGIRRVPAVGAPFDPHLHEATASTPSSETKGTVIEEQAPGYTLHGRLLRPSRVVISSGEQQEKKAG